MDFLRIWMVFRAHYRWILAITLIVMAGTYLHMRRIPKIYMAVTRIVVPQKGSSPGAAFIPGGGRGDSLAGLVAGSLGIQATGTMDLFMAYLDSRTMAEDVVAHFDIQRRFNISEPQKATMAVMGMREFIPKKTGTIDIQVEATDPRFAADMANFYAGNLDRMNRTYSITDAGRNRRFIEVRLAETHKALREAEERVRQFEERNKTLAGASALEGSTEGSKRSLDTFTRLQNTLIEEEMRLASMRMYATDENPDVMLQRLRIERVQRQLEEAQYGNPGNPAGRKKRDGNTDRSFSLPVAELPSTLLEGIRLRRDLKLQEAMFSLLSSQLEQAKIAEARDLPTLQILDRAIPPLYPVKPLVRRSVQFAGFLTFVLACLAAYGWDSLRRWQAQTVSARPGPTGSPETALPRPGLM
jgi:uncharacterized protein involved in exopolysaccharide biosynthesis